jgi:hypothetical protein
MSKQQKRKAKRTIALKVQLANRVLKDERIAWGEDLLHKVENAVIWYHKERQRLKYKS